jgi:XTP/dITP diphosphohydrolase
VIRLLVATRNPGKKVELQRILDAALAGASTGVAVVTLDEVPAYPEVPETGLTFADNALAKAREGVEHTGLPTVADDSGLAVDALNGMPGVLSARWAGRRKSDLANLELVLDQIEDLPDTARCARFICVAALVLPDGREFTVTGELTGVLVRSPRGEGGFGYDPIFLPDGSARTSAELTPAEKDAISHRGTAFRELAGVVRDHLLT